MVSVIRNAKCIFGSKWCSPSLPAILIFGPACRPCRSALSWKASGRIATYYSDVVVTRYKYTPFQTENNFECHFSRLFVMKHYPWVNSTTFIFVTKKKMFPMQRYYSLLEAKGSLSFFSVYILVFILKIICK